MNFIVFPDLAQEEAAIDEKVSPVDDNYATFEVQAEMNWEIYVPQLYFCNALLIIVIIGFEADIIYLLHTFVLLSLPQLSHLS